MRNLGDIDQLPVQKTENLEIYELLIFSPSNPYFTDNNARD